MSTWVLNVVCHQGYIVYKTGISAIRFFILLHAVPAVSGPTLALSEYYIYILIADPVVSGGARQRSRALDLSVPRRAACAGPSSSVCRVKLPYCHISAPVPRLPVGRSLAVALAFRHLFVGVRTQRERLFKRLFPTDGFGWLGLTWSSFMFL